MVLTVPLSAKTEAPLALGQGHYNIKYCYNQSNGIKIGLLDSESNSV